MLCSLSSRVDYGFWAVVLPPLNGHNGAPEWKGGCYPWSWACVAWQHGGMNLHGAPQGKCQRGGSKCAHGWAMRYGVRMLHLRPWGRLRCWCRLTSEKSLKELLSVGAQLCVSLLMFLIDWYRNGFHDLVAATLEASIPAGLCICPELLCLVTPQAVPLGGLLARAISGTRGTLESLYLCQGCLWWCVLPFILSSSLCAMAWSWTAVLAAGARGPSVCLWLELAVDACCALGLRDSLLAGVSLVVGLVVFAQIRVLADWHHHRM